MKFIVNTAKVLGVLLLIILATWFLGPKASYESFDPVLPELKISLDELDDYLIKKESVFEKIKPENESRIIWADAIRQTDYALVYLHGFSAGVMEGASLHMEVAERYGMNLYLPRLSQHGMDDEESFLELTPKSLIDDAKEALRIGQLIGKKVIIMSCSTGGTLAIYLMANHPDIAAHLSYSANIALFDPKAKMMTGPWGLQILNQTMGEYREPKGRENLIDSVRQKVNQYWSGRYRVEGLVALQALIDRTMTEETFRKVNQPYFMGYYYRNDTAQDMTVSVEAMRSFDRSTSTPDEMKRVVAFENVGGHVINSSLVSKDYESVREATFLYIEEILGIEPVMQ